MYFHYPTFYDLPIFQKQKGRDRGPDCPEKQIVIHFYHLQLSCQECSKIIDPPGSLIYAQGWEYACDSRYFSRLRFYCWIRSQESGVAGSMFFAAFLPKMSGQ